MSTAPDITEYLPFPPRYNQDKIISGIVQGFNKYDHIILAAPTGFGKSYIAYALANYYASLGEKSYILTSDKGLQDQYVDSYAGQEERVHTVKGRANYNCDLDARLKCDMGVCKKDKKIKCTCPYIRARHAAYNNHITVLNYSYYFNMFRSDNSPQKPRHLMVLDEAHSGENNLLDFASIEINRKDFKEFELGYNFIPNFPNENDSDKSKMDRLKAIALPTYRRSFEKETAYFESLENDDSGYVDQSRKVKYLDTMVCMINRTLEQTYAGVPTVVQQNGKLGVSYKLLYARGFTGDYYHSMANKFLYMSATIFSKEQFCSDMGLDPEKVAMINLPSLFPVENRPIWKTYVGKMNYKNVERLKPNIVETIDKILERYKDQKGIVHCTNFDLAKYVIENSKYKNRFILPKGRERGNQIKLFKRDGGNSVLISPSISEGLDLGEDQSRFCVITKIPYGNLGDTFVKKRMNIDPKWYQIKTVERMVQSTGRSIRSITDHADTFILDTNFDNFLRQNRTIIPQWWKNSIKIGRI